MILTKIAIPSCRAAARTICQATTAVSLPMKPGTPIPGLDFYKDKEQPVALARDEYPEWIGNLAIKDVSLAKLRRKDMINDSNLREQRRFIKLTRRRKIKEVNTTNRKR
jgi:hypothetical protein